jgi:hypothetical protein
MITSVWLEKDTWVTYKGDTGGAEKGDGMKGKRFGKYRVLGPLCVLRCSSVVVEGVCVRDEES